MKSHKFIDSAPLFCKAGNGGNGSASFRREKFVANGGPDGGDGGNGGNIILKADKDVASLINTFFAPHQRAEHAGPGRNKQMHGKNGKDLILKIPCGTEITNKDTEECIGELVEDGSEMRVAKGGKGGKGNIHWKSSTHQAPTEHTDGERGEEVNLQLELKIVADIGLVGFPNAGKSSLLTNLSDAHPKIASYPFTTLNPIIGTIIFEDYTRRKIADIPGLIEGAHQGIGLGHSFLRHIERSTFLVYVVDMASVDTRPPHKDYLHLREELRLHREDLADRPSIVVANKMDLPEAKDNLAEFRKETGTNPIEVSAETGEGIPALKAEIEKLCKS